MARKVIIPEVIEPDEKMPPDLLVLRRFARLMDEQFAVPGTSIRFGIDPALGLIPVVGDAVAALLSTWIILGALRHRVPMRRVFRMIFNIVLDFAVGSIPVLGDVFDFLFEENMMNLEILMKYRDRRRPPRTAMQMAGAGVAAIGIIVGLLAIIIVALVTAAAALIRNR